MSTNRRKRYPINQSPFFKLKGKGQLERLLSIDLAEVPRLLEASSYRVWANDKGREIQAPINWLGSIHRRIAFLLANVEVPDYVYSQRGRSHIDNASQHRGTFPLIKTDINKFYPSTTREMVVRLFAEDFQCANDLAHVLADLCCYRQMHLPTGSPLSGYIAFLAARPMFDSIDGVAAAQGTRMTLLVDDITISGARADNRLLLNVRRLVRQHGLKTRGAKSRTYAATKPKPVTGAVVVGDELLLPNKQHKKIHATRRLLESAQGGLRLQLQARLKGQRTAALEIAKRRFLVNGE